MSLNISQTPKSSKNNKRLSKFPIVIILAVISLFLLGIFYAVMARKQNLERQSGSDTSQEQEQSTDKDHGNLSSYIDSLLQQQTPVPNMPQKTADTQQFQEEIKVPPPIQNVPFEPAQDELMDESDLRFKKDLQAKAMLSDTRVDIKGGGSSRQSTDLVSGLTDLASGLTSGLVQPPPANEYLANPGIGSMGMQTQGFGLESEVNKDAQGQEFLSQKNDNGYLKYTKQKPVSPYEIKAGWVIPAVLITGVNSDLPGQILAQITQNIYDTATGKYLLIPQGTKVVGAYSSNIIYGQSRLLVAWNKLIYPNGDTLNIDNMQGASQDGYTGFEDEVDNHYFRIFGSAFLLSSITAGISLADKSDRSAERETASDKAIAAAIEQMGQVASEMIRKNMNVSPTIKIRPGYKFNIFVTKDIILEPLEL